MKQLTVIFLVGFTVCSFLQGCKKDAETAESFVRGGTCVVETSDGHLLVGGYTYKTSAGYEAILIKNDWTNDQKSIKNYYGANSTDAFYKTAQLNDTTYVAVGTTFAGSQSPQMFVVLTKEDLTERSRIVLGAGKIARGMSLAIKNDSIIALGTIQTKVNNDRDIYVVKMDKKGGKKWEKTFGVKSIDASANDEAYDIIASKNGGFYITGSMNKQNTPSVFLMKISDNGDSLWTKTYNPGIGYSITYTQDGQLAIGGSFGNANEGHMAVLKLSTDGTMIWNKSYEDKNYSFGATLVNQPSGNLGLCGYIKENGSDKKNAALLIFSPQGNIEKVNIYREQAGNSEAYGLTKTNTGGFSMTGSTTTAEGSFISLYELNADGAVIRNKIFN